MLVELGLQQHRQLHTLLSLTVPTGYNKHIAYLACAALKSGNESVLGIFKQHSDLRKHKNGKNDEIQLFQCFGNSFFRLISIAVR